MEVLNRLDFAALTPSALRNSHVHPGNCEAKWPEKQQGHQQFDAEITKSQRQPCDMGAAETCAKKMDVSITDATRGACHQA